MNLLSWCQSSIFCSCSFIFHRHLEFEYCITKIGMVAIRSRYAFCLFFYLVCEDIGSAATPGLLCQPRVIVKMIMEKQIECRLAEETEVLGESLPQRHFCPSQNSTWKDPGLNPGRRGGKPATKRLSFGAACFLSYNMNELNFQLSSTLRLLQS
jgi:hypothetical protein